MNLLKQCQTLTFSDPKSEEQALKLGEIFLENGFADNSDEIKQYRFAFKNRKVYVYI